MCLRLDAPGCANVLAGVQNMASSAYVQTQFLQALAKQITRTNPTQWSSAQFAMAFHGLHRFPPSTDIFSALIQQLQSSRVQLNMAHISNIVFGCMGQNDSKLLAELFDTVMPSDPQPMISQLKSNHVPSFIQGLLCIAQHNVPRATAVLKTVISPSVVNSMIADDPESAQGLMQSLVLANSTLYGSQSFTVPSQLAGQLGGLTGQISTTERKVRQALDRGGVSAGWQFNVMLPNYGFECDILIPGQDLSINIELDGPSHEHVGARTINQIRDEFLLSTERLRVARVKIVARDLPSIVDEVCNIANVPLHDRALAVEAARGLDFDTVGMLRDQDHVRLTPPSPSPPVPPPSPTTNTNTSTASSSYTRALSNSRNTTDFRQRNQQILRAVKERRLVQELQVLATQNDHCDVVNLSTILHRAAGNANFRPTVLPLDCIQYIAGQLSACDVHKFDPQAIGNLCYGLSMQIAEDPSPDRLVGLAEIVNCIARGVGSCRKSFGSQELGNALYGLQKMPFRSHESVDPSGQMLLASVRNMLTAFCDKLQRDGCQKTTLTTQAIGNSLYGLQGLSDHLVPEVRRLLHLMLPLVRDGLAGGKISAQEFANALYGLQSQASNADVRSIIGEVVKAGISANVNLSPREIGIALFGLQQQRDDYPEVQTAFSFLLQQVLNKEVRAWDGLGVANCIFGLRGSEIGCCTASKRIIRRMLEILPQLQQPLEPRLIAACFSGLRGVTDQSLLKPVSTLFSQQISKHPHESFSARMCQGILYGMNACQDGAIVVQAMLPSLNNTVHQMGQKEVGLILYGLQSCQPHARVVHAVDILIQRLHSLVSDGVDPLAFSQAIQGLLVLRASAADRVPFDSHLELLRSMAFKFLGQDDNRSEGVMGLRRVVSLFLHDPSLCGQHPMAHLLDGNWRDLYQEPSGQPTSRLEKLCHEVLLDAHHTLRPGAMYHPKANVREVSSGLEFDLLVPVVNGGTTSLLNIEIDGPSHLHPGGRCLADMRDVLLRKRGILVTRIDNTAMRPKPEIIQEAIRAVGTFDADLASVCKVPPNI